MNTKKTFLPRQFVTFLVLIAIFLAFWIAFMCSKASGLYINYLLYPLQLAIIIMSVYTFLPAFIYIIFKKQVNALFDQKLDIIGSVQDLPKFILLIPAHNEEASLPNLLENITNKLDYPKSKVRVIVIADNCTDATADIARNAIGIELYERKTSVKSDKTQALAYAAKIFERFPLEEKDAMVVILDADGILSPSFLHGLAEEMVKNPHLEVLQSNRGVLNKHDSDTSLLDAASEAIRQKVNSGIRSWLGMENYLYGLGSCFHMKIFIEMTLLEQLVFADDKAWKAHLAERKISVGYAPKATLEYLAYSKKDDFQVQRLRWVRGHYDMIKKFFIPMFTLAIRRLNISILDFSFSIITLPRTFLLMFCALFLGISVLNSSLSLLPYWVWLVTLLAYLFYGVLGLNIIQSKKYKVLFTSYALVFGVIKANILSMLKSDKRVWKVSRNVKDNINPIV